MRHWNIENAGGDQLAGHVLMDSRNSAGKAGRFNAITIQERCSSGIVIPNKRNRLAGNASQSLVSVATKTRLSAKGNDSNHKGSNTRNTQTAMLYSGRTPANRNRFIVIFKA